MDDLGPPPARLPGSSGFLSSGSLPGPTLYTQVASTTSGNAGAAGTQGQDGATEVMVTWEMSKGSLCKSNRIFKRFSK